MKIKFAALIASAFILAAPAHSDPRFLSSLAAVSELCAFQTIYPGADTLYEAVLLADFSKATPELNSFAAQGLITGISGPKSYLNGSIEQFVIFDQNRFDSMMIKSNQTPDSLIFDFRGKHDEITLGRSLQPTSECNITYNGQSFKFLLKTIDPQYVTFWTSKLKVMTGNTAKPAKGLSRYISNHTLYWMMQN